jgi:uncharacterized protein YcfJ
MPNPYAQRYEQSGVDWKKVEGKKRDPRKDREARERSKWLGYGAAAAPVVGGLAGAGIGALVGGPAGAGLGMGIGGAAGGLLGQGLGAASDEQTREQDEEEARKRARYEAVARLLGEMK